MRRFPSFPEAEDWSETLTARPGDAGGAWASLAERLRLDLVAEYRMLDASDSQGDYDLNTNAYSAGMAPDFVAPAGTPPAGMPALVADFDGTQGLSLEVSDGAADLAFGDADFSISAWFYPRAVVGGILFNGSYGTAYNYDLSMDGGTGTFARMWDVTTPYSAAIVAAQEEWHLAIVRYVAADNKTYFSIDGSAESEIAGALTKTTDTAFGIGGYFYPAGNLGANPFDGQVSQVLIAARSWDAAERAWLWNDGEGNFVLA